MNYDAYEHLHFEKRPSGALQVTINRPEVLNATNARLHWELTQVWATVDADDSVRSILITGAGRAFSAGGDLEMLETMVGKAEAVEKMRREAADVVYNILACEKPIVSAINGVAVGAGLAVALLADISIMAEDARFTDGHVRLGVAAGDHAAIVWPLLCGIAKAKYLLMTADFIDGREAERVGLVSLCAPADELMPRATELADRLAKGSQPAIRSTKRSLNQWMLQAAPIFEHSLSEEMRNFLGADAIEGVKALREKRAPDFPSAKDG